VIVAVVLKTERQLALMRQANCIVGLVLQAMRDLVRPGITTAELDEVAEAIIRQHDAVPSFKGYPHRGVNDFPASICSSINQEIVHGIPSPQRVLVEGDIVSIDVGTIYPAHADAGSGSVGFHGDGAITLPVGRISKQAKRLLDVTEGALMAGIAQAWPGKRVSDISRAIETYVRARGYEVVREYTGHGIGTQMHEEPQIPNYYRRDAQSSSSLGARSAGGWDPVLEPGMTLAIEPMVNIGTWKTRCLPDGWTVETADGKLSAHFEHTLAITDGGPDILTCTCGCE
jgi:methionyl aminopeptidase